VTNPLPALAVSVEQFLNSQRPTLRRIDSRGSKRSGWLTRQGPAHHAPPTGVRVDPLGEADLPFAQLQRDLCQAIKSDPDLKRHPVFMYLSAGLKARVGNDLWLGRYGRMADRLKRRERRSEDASSKGSSWMRLAG
jgi:hypothetical protein